jgi:DNA-binding transcriptional ArsR family regulator
MEIISRSMLTLIADRFKLLSSPTRLDILQHICEEEKTVSSLVELTGCKQANVSRHLGLLDRAGVVSRRLDGNFVYYRVADEDLPRLCEVMKESLRKHQERLNVSLGETPQAT